MNFESQSVKNRRVVKENCDNKKTGKELRSDLLRVAQSAIIDTIFHMPSLPLLVCEYTNHLCAKPFASPLASI